MARRTFLAKGGALGGLDDSAQYVSGAAERRLGGMNAGDLKAQLGVEGAIRLAQPPAALGNDADAAPCTVGDLKNFGQQLLRGTVAVEGDNALVGVFDLVAP